MNTQHKYSLLTACVLACAVVGFAPRPASAQVIGSVTGDHHKLPVTAVGCLQRERDYRSEHSKHHSRGVSNEYVLVNATMGVPSMQIAPAPEAEVNNCLTSQGNGQAFELTGRGERGLEPFVGRRVVISGELKHAKHDPEAVGTSGDFIPIPKGGDLIGGGDLELREVNVDSFALAPIAAPIREEPAYTPEPAPAPAPEPVPQAAPEPQAPPPAPAAPELPKTASPLPAIGLIGLFSLAGALGLRLLRPRTRPF
jgi:hypothetical protein